MLHPQKGVIAPLISAALWQAAFRKFTRRCRDLATAGMPTQAIALSYLCGIVPVLLRSWPRHGAQ